MIQRLQSVFLLLAALCLFGLFFVPFATSEVAMQGTSFLSDANYNLFDSPALLITYSLGGILSLIAVFFFQNRIRQLLLGRIAIVLVIVGMALTVLLFLTDTPKQVQASVNDAVGTYLPFVAVICLFLGLRYIQKDEKLVRSMDRLR